MDWRVLRSRVASAVGSRVARILDKPAVRTWIREHTTVESVESEACAVPQVRVAPPMDTDPDRFGTETSHNGVEIPVVHLESEADFAWMERRILDDGYYESDGIWSFDVDIDKRAIAWQAVCLGGPGARVLDIGCANGPLVAAMRQVGLDAWGIDISTYALENADAGVRDFLIQGDVLTHHFDAGFDVIVGLDVLEHVSPYRVPSYLERIAELLNDGGMVLLNIPVWGDDPVWGNIFPLGPCTYHHAMPSWQAEFDRNEVFTVLPVDDDGYPVLGHLVWAGTQWWLDRFAGAGLVRNEPIERAIHDRSDWFNNIVSIARRSFYVLEREAAPTHADAVLSRITERFPDSAFFPPYPAG